MFNNQIGAGDADSTGNERRFLLGLRQFERQATWFTLIMAVLVSLYPSYTIAQVIETGGSTTLSTATETPTLLPKTIVRKVWLTAYTSSPEETDDTPNITASGLPTGDGIAAANFLPFGTKFQIPDVFGKKVFTIQDRMHPRKVNFVDVWVEDKKTAYRIGIRQTEIVILIES